MFILDIETCPRSEDELLEHMPERFKGAKMPEEISHPVKPDFIAQCPAYASKKEGETESKRAAWIKEKEEKWIADSEKAREGWELKQAETRQKFFDSAALDPKYSEVKLIGWRDLDAKETFVLVCNATSEQRKVIDAGTYSKKATIVYGTEGDMLVFLCAKIKEHVIVKKRATGEEEDIPRRIVTYAGAIFDMPYIRRRMMILGIARNFPRALRKGRYWSERYHIDLMEEWQMGDRQESTGGLDGLAHLLGVKRKTDSGAGFWIKFRDTPAAGVQYLIDDLDCEEQVAYTMGIL